MKHSLLLCLWCVFLISIFLNILKKSLEVHTLFQPSATLRGRSLNWILEHRPRANEPMLLAGNQGQKKHWGRHQIISLQNPRIYRMLVAPNMFARFSMLFHPKTSFPTFPSYSNFAWLKPLPRCSMYGIFTNICPKNHPNVGKYSIHGASGLWYPIPQDIKP